MSIDISKNLLRNFASEGGELSEGKLRTLQTPCLRTAEETISRYNDDASVNGLFFWENFDIA